MEPIISYCALYQVSSVIIQLSYRILGGHLGNGVHFNSVPSFESYVGYHIFLILHNFFITMHTSANVMFLSKRVVLTLTAV